jgi:hypothetical protein
MRRIRRIISEGERQMSPALWHSNEGPLSVIRDQVGPSYEDLRPGKPTTTATFPAYPDLVATMVKDGRAHPDPAIAQVLATCAGYAYSDVGTVSMMMTRIGLENSLCREITRSVDAMLINSTAHLVQSRDGRVVIVAFRGTPPLDLISWFLDADTYPETMASGADSHGGDSRPYEVHAGFYRNVRVTRHEIIHALQQALRGESIVAASSDGSFRHVSTADTEQDTGQRAPLEALYITGHSLGGAMAMILASMLVMSDNPEYQAIAAKLKAVYTFGQPMVGSPDFAEAAADQFRDADIPAVRYVFKKDPVPLLPPRSIGDFAHFGQEYRLGRDGDWTASESSKPMPWVAGLVNSFASFGLTKFLPLRDLPFQHKIEDHFPHHYVSSLIPDGHPDEFGDYYTKRTD